MNSHEEKIQKQLAIPVSLLDEKARKRPWANLGDWSDAREYSVACEALACRIGRAAQLSPADTLLELACGHGASLSVWPSVFGVPIVDAMERQTDAVASIQGESVAALRHLWQADVNLIFSGACDWPTDERYDAVVVVDAAYHFHSLLTFLEKSRSRLKSGGRVAFTTLILDSKWSMTAERHRRFILRLAAHALIPAESLVTKKDLIETFLAAGFNPPICETLDHEVLQGFAGFVERRRRTLNWRQRLSAGWWKVEATAAAARYLLRTGLMHYVLVKAVKA